MNMFSKVRATLSEFRAQVNGLQAEIDRLSAEKATLEHAPIRFDCWRAAMLQAIDLQADAAPARMIRRWESGVRSNNYLLTDPVRWFQQPSKLLHIAPLFGSPAQTPVTDTADAGLSFSWLLLLLRDDIKRSFAERIEPLRASWPKDSECGPPMDVRISRLTEIDARLAKLTGERDEALGVMSEITAPLEAVEESG